MTPCLEGFVEPRFEQFIQEKQYLADGSPATCEGFAMGSPEGPEDSMMMGMVSSVAVINASTFDLLVRAAILSFRPSTRRAWADVRLSPYLLSELPLSSYKEFLVFFLALRTRLFAVDFSPDKAPATWRSLRQNSRSLLGIVEVLVFGPSIFFC